MRWMQAWKVCLLGALVAAPVSAQTPADGGTPATRRGVLESLYVSDYESSNALYESAPVTHVVPSFKTVTFALAAQSYDVAVTESGFAGSPPRSIATPEQRLDLTGYSLAPYLAISLERIGLGFGVESGARAVDYKLYDRNNPDTAVTGGLRQRSEHDYRAVGIYLYLLPYESRGDRPLIASMVVGAKDYNVKAKISPSIDPARFDGRYASFRYSVTEYELGFLFELRLLKKFSLVPWVDYTYVDVHDSVSQADEILSDPGSSSDLASAAAALKGDSFVLWRARPRVDVGLDLVVRVAGFAVHLGELFGYVIDQQGSDAITDNGYYVSVSFDMKGQ
jgi:hypothetical protein